MKSELDLRALGLRVREVWSVGRDTVLKGRALRLETCDVGWDAVLGKYQIHHQPRRRQ